MNNFLDGINLEAFRATKEEAEEQKREQQALSKELAEYCHLELRLEELSQDRPTETHILELFHELYLNYNINVEKITKTQIKIYGSELMLLNTKAVMQGFKAVLLEKTSVYPNDNLLALLVERAKEADYELKHPIWELKLEKEDKIRNDFSLDYFDFKDKVAETLPLLPNYSKK